MSDLYLFYNCTGHCIGALTAEEGCGSERVVDALKEAGNTHITVVRTINQSFAIFDNEQQSKVEAALG